MNRDEEDDDEAVKRMKGTKMKSVRRRERERARLERGFVDDLLVWGTEEGEADPVRPSMMK